MNPNDNPFTTAFDDPFRDVEADTPTEVRVDQFQNNEQTGHTVHNPNYRRDEYRTVNDPFKQPFFGRRNFPPFYPLITHDIEREIPGSKQRTMNLIYKSWLIFSGILLLNFLTCFIDMFTSINIFSKLWNFLLSLFYVILASPLSFLGWYRPLYLGFKNKSNTQFYIFFIGYFIYMLFLVYLILGLPYTGTSGIMNLIGTLSSNWIIIIFSIVVVVANIGLMLFAFYIYQAIIRCFKNNGHTFDEAKHEIFMAAASNSSFRNAAFNFATGNR